MENRNVIIVLVLVIVILALSVGILLSHQNIEKQKNVETGQVEDVQESSSVPDTITVELPEFDKTYTATAGEYTVKASKWMGSSVGEFDVYLYKNGQQVNRDSYMYRAYFYMDGEWKWSEWGNGEDANYHKYPVSNDVEIQEIEVKF